MSAEYEDASTDRRSNNRPPAAANSASAWLDSGLGRDAVSPVVAWSRRHAAAARAARADQAGGATTSAAFARLSPVSRAGLDASRADEPVDGSAAGAVDDRDGRAAPGVRSGRGFGIAFVAVVSAAVSRVVCLLGWLAGLVMVGAVLAGALHANPSNQWVELIRSWARRLDLSVIHRLVRLLPFDGAWEAAVLTAAVWVLLGTLLSRLLRWVVRRVLTSGRRNVHQVALRD
jgi:hypothetical protein